jgi:hypothetical protein
MSLDNVKPGKKIPESFNVIIEISMNADPIKYEVDKESGAIFVDRFMGTSMHYPCNYGYIPKTIAGDGDPVDVLVVTPFPCYPWRGGALPCLGPLKDDRRSRRRRQIDRGSRGQNSADLQPLESRLQTFTRCFSTRSNTSLSITKISKKASGSRSKVGAVWTTHTKKYFTASSATTLNKRANALL